jgi:hypothetical protein
LRVLNDIAHAVVRLFTGDPPRSMAPEILAQMKEAARRFDIDAFAAGAHELLDDSVRLVYDAKLSAMTRPRRQEIGTMTDDELASWLYDMCVDAIPELPPLKARMMLSAACTRHAKGVIR